MASAGIEVRFRLHYSECKVEGLRLRIVGSTVYGLGLRFVYMIWFRGFNHFEATCQLSLVGNPFSPKS